MQTRSVMTTYRPTTDTRSWRALNWQDASLAAEEFRLALSHNRELPADSPSARHPLLRHIEHFRPAAVLLLLHWRPQGVDIILTKRQYHLKHHPGQISLPGGRQDPQDRDLAATALREAHEEIGLPSEQVRMLGGLPALLTVSGYEVTPLVGWLDQPFRATPNPGEVAQVFHLPLLYLLNPDHAHRFRIERRSGAVEMLAIPYQAHFIWGASASMLNSFRQRLLLHRPF